MSTMSFNAPTRAPSRVSLSVYVPPASLPITGSRFSPDSPTHPPPRRSSLFSGGRRSRSQSRDTLPRVSYQSPRPPPAAPLPPPPPITEPESARESKLHKWIFRLRTRDVQPVLPVQRPLLLSEKTPAQTPALRKTWYQRIWTTILIIVIIFLLINTIVLNLRISVLERLPSTSTSTPPSAPANLSALTPAQEQCIVQFSVNAVAAPASYPSSSCAGALASVSPAAFTANATLAQQVGEALDFSGLKGVFDAASKSAQQSLFNGGWLDDVRFCTWSGVTCDMTGRVKSLQLTAPGVPQNLPDELGALTMLQTLSIIGDNTSPGGSAPASLTGLSKLSNLHLEATGLSSLVDDLFSSLTNVSTLVLVKNVHMDSVPSSVTSLFLRSLIVNGQAAPALPALLSSPALQHSLSILDLSQSPLSSLPSDFSMLGNLTELHVPSAGLSGSFPTSLPGGLLVLDASNNTNLGGTLPSALCGSSILRTCSLASTGFSNDAAGSCGPCTFL